MWSLFDALVLIGALPILPNLISCTDPGWIVKEDACLSRVKQNPEEPSNWIELLDAQYHMPRFKESIRTARRALKRFPNNPRILARAARANWSAGRLSKAQYLLERIDPEEADGVGLTETLWMSAATGEKERFVNAYQRLADEVGSQSEAQTLLDDLVETLRMSHAVTYDGVRQPVITHLGSTSLKRTSDERWALQASTKTGDSLLLLLDSGSSNELSLSKSYAHLLDTNEPKQGTRLSIAGWKNVNESTIDRLRIGNITLQNVPLAVRQSERNDESDGTLGMAVFSAHRVTLNNARSTLAVTDSGSGTNEVSNGESVRFWMVGHFIAIEAEIDGHGPAACILDTGTSNTVISHNLAEQIAPSNLSLNTEIEFRSFGHIVRQRTTVLQDLEFNLGKMQLVLSKVPMVEFIDEQLNPSMRMQVGMVIGMDVIGAMDQFIVDYPRRRIHFVR